MNIFDFLSLIGGLALFLFGMQVMGNALEKKAGGQLNTVLGKITEPYQGLRSRTWYHFNSTEFLGNNSNAGRSCKL